MIETRSRGIYDVCAWVNPGERGEVRLEIVDLETGASLARSEHGKKRLIEHSNERIGWSTKSDEVFYYNARIVAHSDQTGRKHQTRFELWFTPIPTGEPRLLLSDKKEIRGWRR